MAEPKSLIQIITEEEFLALAQDPCVHFLNICFLFELRIQQKRGISRKFYSNLIQEAEFLESFMDEHGARENKKWVFFVEYLASIRNLSIAAFFTRHLLDRYPYYGLGESPDLEKAFQAKAREVLEFLNQSIFNLYKELIKTGTESGLSIPQNPQVQMEFADIVTNKRLPRNITEDEVKDEEDRIIDLCEKVQHVARLMADAKIKRTDEVAELKRMVRNRLDEKHARLFKNLVHSVQSDFDTYVKNTKLEQDHADLKKMRGYISMPMHLLEVSLWLAHFYERHEDEIRSGESKRRISKMVNKDELLDKIVNFGFYYSLYFIQKGTKLAEEILKCFSKTVRAELPIPQPLGFHARPSTYISLIARQYGEGNLFLIVDGKKFNAKSVMSLLQLGGLVADKGYQTIVYEGDKRIVDDIRILVKHNYCEESEIPARLSYLRDFKNTA
ncbi:MAG: HPr family phosphocarrier protein [Nitrospinae bacterium]|nr:HPr family phosphocarrier protein [Nitrospinota bacterium]